MDGEKRIREWVENHDGDDWCRYCIFNDDCARGVTGGPDGPIFPPCADGDYLENCLDTDALMEDLGNEDGRDDG